MTYHLKIVHEKIFAKDISKISKSELVVILEKIDQLRYDGIQHAQVKRLKNYSGADFRLRVGNYRVLFNLHLETETIALLRVLHRSQLY